MNSAKLYSNHEERSKEVVYTQRHIKNIYLRNNNPSAAS